MRPLSLVVLGNSVALMQVPPRKDPADGTYGEVLADLLHEAGVPTDLHLEARWFEFAHQGLRRYPESVSAHAPDVFVVQYGFNELQPWLLPVPVVRHLMTDHLATSRTARWYRRTVVPPVWRRVRGYRRWASARVGLRTWQLSPHRLRHSVQQLVRAARYTFRPLVLVLDVNPPGASVRHFLPGVEARHPLVQQALADAVAHFDDPDVRLVPASRVVAEMGEESALPDGIHWSPEAHRRVAELLADEVLDWLGQRPSSA